MRQTLIPCLVAATLLAASTAATAQLGVAAPGGADAQQANPFQTGRAPVPTQADSDPPMLLMFAVAFLIVAVGFGAMVIPSKRGHQD